MQTAEETAVLIAFMLRRTKQTRARLSETTIRVLAGRRQLRMVFLRDLRDYLEDMGFGLHELDRGGFGVFQTSVLEGAKPCTAKVAIPQELAKLRNGKLNIASIRRELLSDLRYEEHGE